MGFLPSNPTVETQLDSLSGGEVGGAGNTRAVPLRDSLPLVPDIPNIICDSCQFQKDDAKRWWCGELTERQTEKLPRL